MAPKAASSLKKIRISVLGHTPLNTHHKPDREKKGKKRPKIRAFQKNFPPSLLSYTEKEIVIIQSEKRL